MEEVSNLANTVAWKIPLLVQSCFIVIENFHAAFIVCMSSSHTFFPLKMQVIISTQCWLQQIKTRKLTYNNSYYQCSSSTNLG